MNACRELGLPLQLIVLDAERRIVAADPTVEAVLGRSAEALTGAPIESLFSVRDRRGQASYYEQLGRGQPIDAVLDFHVDGNDKLMRLRMRPMHAGWHAFVEFVGHASDPIFQWSVDRDRWRAVVEQSPNGICTLDPAGHVLTHNIRFLELMRFESMHGVSLSPDSVTGKQLTSLLPAEGFEPLRQAFEAERPRDRRFSGLARHGESCLGLELRPTFLRRALTGFCLTVRDRTTEEELNQLRTAAARSAGMSEVASGVLHNVGNALNSVNVSISCLESSIQDSKVDRVSKIGEMLVETEDVARFMTEDERGKAIPRFLLKLGEELAATRQRQTEELERLASYIAHIKRAIRDQQHHARPVTVDSLVYVDRLVARAAEVGVRASSRPGTAVHFHVDSLPELSFDEHLVMDILVNLTKNAGDACVDCESPRIDLHAHLDDETLRFAVTDNGIGIEDGQLDRIFASGFTTKSEGHGLGLHSSANAARRLGGSLSAASDGVGCGASFELTIPVRRLSCPVGEVLVADPEAE